jgi:hypothetical protein
MGFRSLVIPIRMKEGFTMVYADRFPVRALSILLLTFVLIPTLEFHFD